MFGVYNGEATWNGVQFENWDTVNSCGRPTYAVKANLFDKNKSPVQNFVGSNFKNVK